LSRYVLNVSDFHVGNMFGLFPANFRTSTDSILMLNSGQRYLLECWEDIISKQPETIDILNLNGDMIDGQNRFEISRGLSEVDPMWQVRAAEQLLEPLVSRAKEIRFTQGSTYHVGRGGAWDEVLAERIGAKRDAWGHYASAWWRYYFPGEDGFYFDLAHRQSTTIRYRSMPLERELDFCLGRFARMGVAPPSKIVITRSHTHVGYSKWEEECGIAVSTPAMKLQDDFAKTRITPNRIIPDNLGVVGYYIDGDELHVEPYLYRHPEQGVDVIQ